MRRKTLRSFGAAMVLVPLVATCTQPTGMVAQASEHLQTASEDRLAAFLIDGRIAASTRR